MISRSLRNWGKPRVMCRNCLRSLGFRRRLTNKKRSWNTSLIFSCICLLWRAKRRAAFSVDDGRPRFNLGVDLVKRALFGHCSQDPLRQLLEDMEGTNLMRHLAKDRADRLGRERRTIRRDALECQVTILQGRFHTPPKGRDVVMGGIVIE